MRYLHQYSISPSEKPVKEEKFTNNLDYNNVFDRTFLHARNLAHRKNIKVSPKIYLKRILKLVRVCLTVGSVELN